MISVRASASSVAVTPKGIVARCFPCPRVSLFAIENTRHYGAVFPRAIGPVSEGRRTGRVAPLYVSLFGGGFNVYAAFGTVLLFVLGLYLVGVALVGGAERDAFPEQVENDDRQDQPDGLRHVQRLDRGRAPPNSILTMHARG